ncbi:peptide-N(4)-(N-acetyl-beta-glucosaminyl)asparagine amidase-like isoform X2 [Gordionus sp. m RMFG-2023]|uniref:peptide-N(4)-(N-acetyl-beta- glucosaminyl)asparagine amidase-like isoform X2 n=1 Tax=Gordionus sp. m RMFG-2023 TaxID=3053472 RepID=UPI0031FD5E77
MEEKVFYQKLIAHLHAAKLYESLSLRQKVLETIPVKSNKCGTIKEFPRFNDPGVLLESRTGRCGEWANCFTLILRALDFETRYVADWSDHVWCEYYSTSQQRWIHIDPCECICDKPLLYHIGWAKPLSYIIAFSSQEIMDVSWRYSNDHKTLLKRRNLISETWLYQTIKDMNARLRQDLLTERIDELNLRTVKELVEFMSPPEVVDGQAYPGRISGDIDWKQSRGETGPNIINKNGDTNLIHKANVNFASLLSQYCKNEAPYSDELEPSFSFSPSTSHERLLHVLYFCSSDEYCINQNNNNAVKNGVPGFRSLSYITNHVIRKTERDWRTCYLCPEPGHAIDDFATSAVKIVWKVSCYDPYSKSLSKNDASSQNTFAALVDKSFNNQIISENQNTKSVHIPTIKRIKIRVKGTQVYDTNIAQIEWRLNVHYPLSSLKSGTESILLSANENFDIDTEEYIGADYFFITAQFIFPKAFENSLPYKLDGILWQKAQIFRTKWVPPLSNFDKFLNSTSNNYTNDNGSFNDIQTFHYDNGDKSFMKDEGDLDIFVTFE